MQQCFKQARESMIECQIRPNKVTDAALLEAIRRIPREKFLAVPLQGRAYVDEDIALGSGRYLLEPAILARLIQAASIQRTDNVLDIGCGTGYSTAILSALCHQVIGVEQDQGMIKEAIRLMNEMGISNAQFHSGLMQEGYPHKAPYDVILINGAVAGIPDSIKSQLAPQGRLVTVVSRHGHIGSGVLVNRYDNSFSTHNLFDAATPFLPGFEEKKAFVF